MKEDWVLGEYTLLIDRSNILQNLHITEYSIFFIFFLILGMGVNERDFL